MSSDRNHSEQFERYLKGQMSSEEAHAFEREVLDDPFAQEALEGFEENDAEAIGDLKSLRSRIEVQPKKAFPFMRIAAVVALLIVGSVAVLLFTERIGESQLAMEEEPVEELSQQGPAPDTVPSSANSQKLKEVDKSEELASKIEKTQPPVNKTPTKEPIPLVDEMPVDTFAYNQDDEADLMASNLDEKVGVYELELTEIESPNLKETDASDENQYSQSKLAKEESEPRKRIATVERPSVSNRSVAARSMLSDTSVVESESLEEVVAARSGAGAADTNTFTPAQPMGGFKSYKEYLKESLQYPDAAIGNEIEGTVMLNLTIDSSGQISNIDITRSLGYGCDREAMRLVKEGPKWEPAKKEGLKVEDKVKVKVRFKR